MQIEIGRFYRDAEGSKRGPMIRLIHSGRFYEYGRADAEAPEWTRDGKSFSDHKTKPAPDLVAEWVEPAAPIPEQPADVVKHMVDRFLAWKLPEHFLPDCGIRFSPSFPDEPMRSRHWPTGTNLFDASQAEAMVRYMLEGLPFPHLTVPMWINVDEAGKLTPLVEVNELERLRRMVKAHADHKMNLAKQIDAMTDTASIYRAECERLKKREAELLEANNRYLDRARNAEAAVDSMSTRNADQVIAMRRITDERDDLVERLTEARASQPKPHLRPTLRDCPMCGADGKNDEKVAFIAHNHICSDVEYEMGYAVRCFECGASVSDEYESEAVRLWNGKQNAEQCTACGEYLDEGDLVYNESGEGGFIHADCCDKSDVTGFTDEDGNPLQPGDKIPEPFAWEGGAA